MIALLTLGFCLLALWNQLLLIRTQQLQRDHDELECWVKNLRREVCHETR